MTPTYHISQSLDRLSKGRHAGCVEVGLVVVARSEYHHFVIHRVSGGLGGGREDRVHRIEHGYKVAVAAHQGQISDSGLQILPSAVHVEVGVNLGRIPKDNDAYTCVARVYVHVVDASEDGVDVVLQNVGHVGGRVNDKP